MNYTRSSDTIDSAAIDPIFQTTAITNGAGWKDHPFFRSSTTHLEGHILGSNAAYVAIVRAIGPMN